MELFDQSIDHDNSPGVRLNVVTFCGNDRLMESLQKAKASFSSEVLKEVEGPPTAKLILFPDMTQEQGKAVASLIREAGFESAGACYAAVRYSTAPGNNVDYLIAFE